MVPPAGAGGGAPSTSQLRGGGRQSSPTTPPRGNEAAPHGLDGRPEPRHSAATQATNAARRQSPPPAWQRHKKEGRRARVWPGAAAIHLPRGENGENLPDRSGKSQ